MSFEGKQFSHYRILQLIGRGGMGEVYLAEDIQIRRQVAVKVIRIEDVQPGSEIISTVLRQFLREATTIARLDHPHILPLYDYGETQLDGSHIAYLIIPYRPEGSLVTWLRKRSQLLQTQQLTLKQVVHVIQQVSQALQYAHDHQIMHLDVKPANFLIRSRSEADEYPDLLLADFGIARLESTTSSASQSVRGTPTYMAPEQCMSQPEFASDQYALAIMAYELLTGSPPFQGAPMNVMFAHIHEQPKPTRDLNPLLPPTIDIVVQRALAKKPEGRFPSVVAFAQAFQEAFEDMNEETTLRVLRPSPVTPQRPEPSSIGDVYATLVISMQEARNGTSRTLTLANGRAVNVQIPPGIQPGQVLTLIGQGKPLGSGNTAGNLYLTLSIVEAQPQGKLADDEDAETYRKAQAAQSAAPVGIASPQPALSPVVTSLAAPVTPPSQPVRDTQPAERDTASNLTPPLSERKVSRRGFIIAGLLGAGALGTIATWAIVSHQASSGTSSTSISLTSTDQTNATSTAQALPGSTWTTQTSGTSQPLHAITWSGSQFVAVGGTYSYSTRVGVSIILTSPDGRTWTTRFSNTNNGSDGVEVLYNVAWSGAQFVAVGWGVVGGYTAVMILTSPDGDTWTAQPQPDGAGSEYLYSVAWSGAQFVAVGTNGVIISSSDGRTWTTRSWGKFANLSSVIWSDAQFVAVGIKGTIISSPDGQNWTAQTSGTSDTLTSIAWSGAQFVAVGLSGTILTSPDGHTWSIQSNSVPALQSVTWSGSQFVAVGDTGTILTSSDDKTWVQQHAPPDSYLLGITWSGSQFVAVGDTGTILTSS